MPGYYIHYFSPNFVSHKFRQGAEIMCKFHRNYCPLASTELFMSDENSYSQATKLKLAPEAPGTEICGQFLTKCDLHLTKLKKLNQIKNKK